MDFKLRYQLEPIRAISFKATEILMINLQSEFSPSWRVYQCFTQSLKIMQLFKTFASAEKMRAWSD